MRSNKILPTLQMKQYLRNFEHILGGLVLNFEMQHIQRNPILRKPYVTAFESLYYT